jgi:hypothetical protein
MRETQCKDLISRDPAWIWRIFPQRALFLFCLFRTQVAGIQQSRPLLKLDLVYLAAVRGPSFVGEELHSVALLEYCLRVAIKICELPCAEASLVLDGRSVFARHHCRTGTGYGFAIRCGLSRWLHITTAEPEQATASQLGAG